MTRVQVLLTDEQDRRLEKLAEARGESKSNLVRRAVDLLLQMEEHHDEPLLADTLRLLRSGGDLVALYWSPAGWTQVRTGGDHLGRCTDLHRYVVE